MKRRVKDVVMIDVPTGSVEVARERTHAIHRSWALHGGRDLESLVLSVYLQGVWDGWQACEQGQLSGEASPLARSSQSDAANED